MNRVVRPRSRGLSALPRTLVFSALLIGGWGLPLPKDLHFIPWLLLAAAFVTLARAAVELRQNRISASRIVILGAGSLAAMLIEELDSMYGAHRVIAGVIDDEPPRDSWIRTRWSSTNG